MTLPAVARGFGTPPPGAIARWLATTPLVLETILRRSGFRGSTIKVTATHIITHGINVVTREARFLVTSSTFDLFPHRSTQLVSELQTTLRRFQGMLPQGNHPHNPSHKRVRSTIYSSLELPDEGTITYSIRS